MRGKKVDRGCVSKLNFEPARKPAQRRVDELFGAAIVVTGSAAARQVVKPASFNVKTTPRHFDADTPRGAASCVCCEQTKGGEVYLFPSPQTFFHATPLLPLLISFTCSACTVSWQPRRLEPRLENDYLCFSVLRLKSTFPAANRPHHKAPLRGARRCAPRYAQGATRRYPRADPTSETRASRASRLDCLDRRHGLKAIRATLF